MNVEEYRAWWEQDEQPLKRLVVRDPATGEVHRRIFEEQEAEMPGYTETVLRSYDGQRFEAHIEVAEWRRTVDEDAPMVCLTHRVFVPCRSGMYGRDGERWCYFTQDERAVEIVAAYHRGDWDDGCGC